MKKNGSPEHGLDARATPASLACAAPVSRSFSQAELDDALEREIETARRAAMNPANSTEEQREFFGAMKILIAQRSPEQIARMEAAKGLRA